LQMKIDDIDAFEWSATDDNWKIQTWFNESSFYW
jgi:hypothetical protein